jgi:hypothetical protein
MIAPQLSGQSSLAAGRVIELWCAERFVAKFEPPPDNGQNY